MSMHESEWIFMKPGRRASATVSKAICIRAVLAVRPGLSPVDDLTFLPPGIHSVSCVWKTQPEAQTNKLRISDSLVRGYLKQMIFVAIECDYPPLNRGIWGNIQGCRWYEISHSYPYPYPQSLRGYPWNAWIYPYSIDEWMNEVFINVW